MIDWRGIREFVRSDPVLKWFFLPLTVAPFALLLWGWLGGVVLAVTGTQFWQDATGTPQGAGAVLGIIGGGATLTAGALFNAWLARHRDDRRREQEAKALAAALHADMLAAITVVGHLLGCVEAYFNSDDKKGLVNEFDTARELWTIETPVYRANLARLGILGPRIDNIAVSGFQLAAKQTRIILHNLYSAGGRDGDGKDTLDAIHEHLMLLRRAADALRKRAGRPPDKNTKKVEQFEADEIEDAVIRG